MTELAGDVFYADLSAEQAGLLDADLLAYTTYPTSDRPGTRRAQIDDSIRLDASSSRPTSPATVVMSAFQSTALTTGPAADRVRSRS